MDIKLKWGVITFAVFILFIIILLLILNTAQQYKDVNGEFCVTIKGNVTTTSDYINSITKPTLVKAYPSLYNFNTLCRSDNIGEPFNISWNGNIGTYSITLCLPVEQEIVITTKCDGCFHERVYLSPNQTIYYKDLKWDVTTCVKSRDYNDPTLASNKGTELLDTVSEESDRENFDRNLSEDIRNVIKEGRSQVKKVTWAGSRNESFYHAWYSILYGWRAFNKVKLAKLKYCLDSIDKEIQSHNDSCYIPSYEGFSRFQLANNTFYSSMKLSEIDYHYDYDQLENMKQEIDYISNQESYNIDIANSICIGARNILSNSLRFQEPYCKRREIIINVIDWLLVVIALSVGIFLGKFGRGWGKNERERI